MQLDFGFPRMELPPRAISGRRAAARPHRSRQLEFYGFDSLQQHTYFFAVLVDEAAAHEVNRLRQSMAERSALAHKGADPAGLHVPLIGLARQNARPLPMETEQAALDAARFVRLPPFEVTFDRVRTHGAQSSDEGAKRPIVLSASNTSGLRALHENLHGVLERARVIGGKLRPFTPYATVFWDAVAVEEAIPPIGWTVREFHLIHSLHGKSQYRIVGSFPLRG